MTLLKNRLWFFIPYLIVGLYFTFQWNTIPSFYHENYFILLLAYFFVVGICVLTAMNKKMFVFEPFTIISTLYICIFLIYPLYDYSRGELLKAGVDTSGGCIKGTLIFVLSFLSFYVAYYSTKFSTRKIAFFERINTLSIKEILLISVFCWLISLVGCVLGQRERGFSLQYMFSLGNIVVDTPMDLFDKPGLLFLLMFEPTLVMCWLLIVLHTKSWFNRILFTIPTMGFLFIRNSRWIVLVAGVAPIVYYFAKHKKNPSLKILFSCALILLTCFSFMQLTRNDIALQRSIMPGVSGKLFSLDTYLAPLESDFSTYKTYYGIVKTFPERADFLLGKGMIGYTLALVIPRQIWKEKPGAPEREVVRVSVGEQAMMNGEAYPNIGIFYSEFGWIGCIFFMALFGFIMSHTRSLYYQDSSLALILYSFLWPFCFQLVARSVCTNVYAILFSLIPFFAFYVYTVLFRTMRRKS